MRDGAVFPAGSVDSRSVEAPVTAKTYLLCGYISGVLGMDFFVSNFESLVSMAQLSSKAFSPLPTYLAVY